MICPSNSGVSCRVESDPTLTVVERKAFTPMVNIDISDGRFLRIFQAPIASRLAPSVDRITLRLRACSRCFKVQHLYSGMSPFI